MNFPYGALCVSDRKHRIFSNIDDIYCEIIKLYDIAKDKGFNLGEALYTQSFFFADHDLLIDAKCQIESKNISFVKSLIVLHIHHYNLLLLI